MNYKELKKRFRLVEKDDDGNIVQVIYESPFYESLNEFNVEHYRCVLKYDEVYDFYTLYDKPNAPLLEFEKQYEGEKWKWMSDAVDDFFNI